MASKLTTYFLVEKDVWRKVLLIIYSLCIVCLIVMVASSPHRIIYDENYFYPNIAYLHNVGLSHFITTYKGQAPGPLYELVHYCTYLLTNSILGVRADNVLFVLLNMWLLSVLLRRSGQADHKLIAMSYLTVPLTWVNSGLALTETPTILFALLFLAILQITFAQPRPAVKHVILLAILLTCAVIGRSTFLVLSLALMGYCIYRFRERRYWLVVVAAVGMIIPAYMFWLWKGLTPPEQAFLSKGNLSFYHFLLMLSYAGIMSLILYPNAITVIRQHYILFLTMLVVVFLFLLQTDILVPLQTIKSIRDHAQLLRYPIVLAYAASSSFFVAAAYNVWRSERSPFFVIVFFILCLLMATSLKITHQFSARYAFQAMPFLLLLFRYYYRTNLLQIIAAITGTLLGIVSLIGYYHS